MKNYFRQFFSVLIFGAFIWMFLACILVPYPLEISEVNKPCDKHDPSPKLVQIQITAQVYDWETELALSGINVVFKTILNKSKTLDGNCISSAQVSIKEIKTNSNGTAIFNFSYNSENIEDVLYVYVDIPEQMSYSAHPNVYFNIPSAVDYTPQLSKYYLLKKELNP